MSYRRLSLHFLHFPLCDLPQWGVILTQQIPLAATAKTTETKHSVDKRRIYLLCK